MSQTCKVSLNDVVRLAEITSGEIKLTPTNEERSEASQKHKEAESDKAKDIQCGYCKHRCETRDDLADHYKTDYHLHNLRLHLVEKDPVALSEFQANEANASGSESDANGAVPFVGSLCLSDSEPEEKTAKVYTQFSNRLPKLYFSNERGECFSLYKKLIYGRKTDQVQKEIIPLCRNLLTSAHRQLWAVILFNGDRFAAAVFEGDVPVVYKTFHFYHAAERKAGQSGNRKKSKNNSKDLRRCNDAKKAGDIYELLIGWKESYLDRCQLVFMKIPPFKMGIFTGGKNPVFAKKDARIRQVPFSTNKPSFKELVRIHAELYCVTWHDKEFALQVFKKSEKKETVSKKNSFKKSSNPGKNVRQRKEKKKQEMYSTPSTNDILRSKVSDYTSLVSKS